MATRASIGASDITTGAVNCHRVAVVVSCLIVASLTPVATAASFRVEEASDHYGPYAQASRGQVRLQGPVVNGRFHGGGPTANDANDQSLHGKYNTKVQRKPWHMRDSRSRRVHAVATEKIRLLHLAMFAAAVLGLFAAVVRARCISIFGARHAVVAHGTTSRRLATATDELHDLCRPYTEEKRDVRLVIQGANGDEAVWFTKTSGRFQPNDTHHLTVLEKLGLEQEKRNFLLRELEAKDEALRQLARILTGTGVVTLLLFITAVILHGNLPVQGGQLQNATTTTGKPNRVHQARWRQCDAAVNDGRTAGARMPSISRTRVVAAQQQALAEPPHGSMILL